MKLGIIAPLERPIPPRTYGGTERIVHALAEGLVEKGHRVTLFAPGNSVTSGKLVATTPRHAADLESDFRRLQAVYTSHLHTIVRGQPDIELWSNHTSHLAVAVAPLLRAPMVTTMHNEWTPEREALYEETSRTSHFVSISEAQRQQFRRVKFTQTIYNATDTDHLALGDGGGGYLAWLGTVADKKGASEAIQLARAAGLPLKLAGPVQHENASYFKRLIKPKLGGGIEYLGEIGDAEKPTFLGQAIALLSPLKWDEPFGLAPIEAMSCGTPVLTVSRGSMPELIEHGVTGFLADTPLALRPYLERIRSLDRQVIRRQTVAQFSLRRMVDEYEALYQSLIQPHRHAAPFRVRQILRSLRSGVGVFGRRRSPRSRTAQNAKPRQLDS